MRQKTSYVVHKGKRSKVETTVMVPGGQIEAGSATSTLPVASGMRQRRTESMPARIRVQPGKAARCWARRSTVRSLVQDRWWWRRSGPRSHGPRTAAKNWQPLAMPHKLTWLQSIAMAGNGSLWLGGREGVFYSEDHGQNWTEMTSLPISDISGLSLRPGSEARRRYLLGLQLGAGH